MSGSPNVLSVKNLLYGLGHYLSFQELLSKYNCNLSFLEYYQVSSAIPNFFLSARGGITLHVVEGFVQRASSFLLDENIELNLEKLKISGLLPVAFKF